MAKKQKTNEAVEEVPAEVQSAPEPVKASRPLSIDGPGVKCDTAEVGSRAARQLEFYAGQEKVRTRIPLGPGERPGKAFETVIVNDLRINILKGMSVSLPEDVAKIIEDGYYNTDKALNETRIAPAFGGGEARPLRVDLQSGSDKAALDA